MILDSRSTQAEISAQTNNNLALLIASLWALIQITDKLGLLMVLSCGNMNTKSCCKLFKQTCV